MYSREFWELSVKRMFRMNGNDYVKQSSRTARLLAYDRVFYFRKTEVVHPVSW